MREAPASLEISPVQLPGREHRLSDPPFVAVDPLVSSVVDRLTLDRPFGLFGHSMGALIAFEVAHALRRRGLRGPERLFVSGFRAPHMPDRWPLLHTLDDRAFVKELRELEGTPDEVAEHEELMALLLPTLRADVTLCETYRYQTAEPLDVPITVFGGTRDPRVSREELEGWREHTRQATEIVLFPGHHFFIKAFASEIVTSIARHLAGGT